MRTLHLFSDGQLVVTDNATLMLKGQEETAYPLDHLSEEEFRHLLEHWEERELAVDADQGTATLLCGGLVIPLQSV